MDEDGAAGPGSARPLRAVLDELTGAGRGDARRLLDEAGHGDLPADLLAEAVVSFAAAAPPALAEHLAPFVTAQSPAALDDAGSRATEAEWGLELLATAPAPDVLDVPVDPDGLDDDDGLGRPEEDAPGEDPDADDLLGGLDLDFGAGDRAATGHEHDEVDDAAPREPEAPDEFAAGDPLTGPGSLEGLEGLDTDPELLDTLESLDADGPDALPQADRRDTPEPDDGDTEAPPPIW